MRRKIDMIVVHCSDSPHRGDTAEDIHAWHLARGWDGIGYHYVITETGEKQAGRPLYWIGSHVAGHNANSIGICLLGRKDFTKEQVATLKQLLSYLTLQYPNAAVLGHNDLDPKKTCPNFDVVTWWNGIS